MGVNYLASSAANSRAARSRSRPTSRENLEELCDGLIDICGKRWLLRASHRVAMHETRTVRINAHPLRLANRRTK